MNAVERTDEELLVALCRGVDSALAELVRRYQTDILRFCVHYLKDVERAREIAQETFIRVYTARERFDTTRKFRPWVLCIARNLCLNDLKRKRAVPMTSLAGDGGSMAKGLAAVLPSTGDDPRQAAMVAERRRLLDAALDTLDDDSREILVLRFFERMSARDIAGITGNTEGGIRTRLHRILRKLREDYGEYQEQL